VESNLAMPWLPPSPTAKAGGAEAVTVDALDQATITAVVLAAEPEWSCTERTPWPWL
jgi:hypothetical protein